MNDRPDEILDGLRDHVRQLQPPDALEGSVVRAVRLDRRRTVRVRGALLVLAGIALLGIGWMLRGLATDGAGAVTDHDGRYVLLLYPSAGEPQLSEEEIASRVREYGAWARAGHDDGVVIEGAKLGDDRGHVNGEGEAQLPVEGFFVVRAASMERAAEIARDCPHTRHGGRIEIRQIE